MKFVPPTINVTEGDGFESDLLNRKGFGDRLTNLILKLEGSATLLLDGPWGSGKTTFVHMWADNLKSKDVPVIYFNAFDNDYLNDAFTALAGEFVAVDAANDTAKEKFIDAAVKIGKSLAVHGSRYAVKAATLGAVDVLELKDVVGEVAEDIAKDAGDSASAIIKGKLLARKTERVAMEQFRNALAAYVADIREKATEGKTPPPLVFIIDELDRCKPDFALALIEGVKHLFNVSGVVFVLVTNLEQMCSAVRATYGPSIDARGYLEKFYHLMVVLPEPKREGAEHALERFLEGIFKELPSDVLDTKVKWGPVHQDMVKHLLLLSERKELTLRKLERLATQIAVVYVSTRDNQIRLAPVIADLCLMKSDAPELYRSARAGTLTAQELERFLPYNVWFGAQQQGISDDHLLWSANLWRYILGAGLLGGEDEANFRREFVRYSVTTPRRLMGLFCSWIDGFALPGEAEPKKS